MVVGSSPHIVNHNIYKDRHSVSFNYGLLRTMSYQSNYLVLNIYTLHSLKGVCIFLWKNTVEVSVIEYENCIYM